MDQQSNGINIVIQGVSNSFLYFIIEHNSIPFTTNLARTDLNQLRHNNPNNTNGPPVPPTRNSHIQPTYYPLVPPTNIQPVPPTNNSSTQPTNKNPTTATENKHTSSNKRIKNDEGELDNEHCKTNNQLLLLFSSIPPIWLVNYLFYHLNG